MGAAGFVVGLRLTIAVEAAGHDHFQLRMFVDEAAALGFGKLGVSQKIDVPRFQSLAVPLAEDLKGIPEHFIMDEIGAMPQLQPLGVELRAHMDGMHISKEAIKENRQRQPAAIGWHGKEQRMISCERCLRHAGHVLPHVRCPIVAAVGGVDDCQVRRKSPHRVAAVEDVILPIVAGEENFLPVHGDMKPHGPGAVARPSPVQGNITIQLQLRRRRVQDHGILRLVMNLLVGLVRHQDRSIEAVLLQEFDGSGVILMGMCNKQILRPPDLLR